MKIQLIATVCLLGLGACTTPDRVDFGGTSYVQAVSGPSQPCETTNLRRQSRAELVYPPSLMAIAYANQSRGFSYTVPLTFDVTPEGRAVNVRFAGNPADTTNSAKREAIFNAAESLSGYQFAWPTGSTPGYALNCRQEINFSTSYQTTP